LSSREKEMVGEGKKRKREGRFSCPYIGPLLCLLDASKRKGGGGGRV